MEVLRLSRTVAPLAKQVDDVREREHAMILGTRSNFCSQWKNPGFLLFSDSFFIQLSALLPTRSGLLTRVYTQNIDALEKIAGLEDEDVVYAHGGFFDAHCIGTTKNRCRKRMLLGDWKRHILAGSVPKCVECGELVKPDIVFFGGDPLPADYWNQHKKDFPKTDCLMVFGTSLSIIPFALLIYQPLSSEDSPRVLINHNMVGAEGGVSGTEKVTRKNETTGEDEQVLLYEGGFRFDQQPTTSRDLFLQADCDAAVFDLCKELGWEAELASLITAAKGNPRDGWEMMLQWQREKASNEKIGQRSSESSSSGTPFLGGTPPQHDVVPASGGAPLREFGASAAGRWSPVGPQTRTSSSSKWDGEAGVPPKTEDAKSDGRESDAEVSSDFRRSPTAESDGESPREEDLKSTIQEKTHAEWFSAMRITLEEGDLEIAETSSGAPGSSTESQVVSPNVVPPQHDVVPAGRPPAGGAPLPQHAEFNKLSPTQATSAGVVPSPLRGDEDLQPSNHLGGAPPRAPPDLRELGVGSSASGTCDGPPRTSSSSKWEAGVPPTSMMTDEFHNFSPQKSSTESALSRGETLVPPQHKVVPVPPAPLRGEEGERGVLVPKDGEKSAAQGERGVLVPHGKKSKATSAGVVPSPPPSIPFSPPLRGDDNLQEPSNHLGGAPPGGPSRSSDEVGVFGRLRQYVAGQASGGRPGVRGSVSPGSVPPEDILRSPEDKKNVQERPPEDMNVHGVLVPADGEKSRKNSNVVPPSPSPNPKGQLFFAKGRPSPKAGARPAADHNLRDWLLRGKATVQHGGHGVSAECDVSRSGMREGAKGAQRQPKPSPKSQASRALGISVTVPTVGPNSTGLPDSGLDRIPSVAEKDSRPAAALPAKLREQKPKIAI